MANGNNLLKHNLAFKYIQFPNVPKINRTLIISLKYKCSYQMKLLSINTFVVCNRHHILLTRRRQTKKGEISMWCQERNRPIPDGTARCPQVSNRILHCRASDIVIHCLKYRHFKLRMILFWDKNVIHSFVFHIHVLGTEFHSSEGLYLTYIVSIIQTLI